jgi:formylglycine-generating enzyme required for sulfatase activity/uncharacterized caspase-like protein
MTKNFAIVIGINQYHPINFRRLEYAENDAESVRDFFLQEARFDNVYFFADNSPDLVLPNGQKIPTAPTSGNLETFLEKRFETPFLSSGDNCWFFFAGHGRQCNRRDYLMPSDANPNDVERRKNWIEVNYIRELLMNSGADNVILMIDACRTEGDRDGMGIGNEPQPGVITIYSCSPKQRSWEVDALQHGVFTFALLEALKVKGKEHHSTPERLNAYLRSRVPALCLEHQMPQQMPSVGADLLEKQHFVLLPQCLEPIDIKTDILRMKNDIYRLAFCEKNLSLAEQIWKRVSALTLGRDEEVHGILQSITLEKRRQQEEAEAQRYVADLRNQVTAAHQQIESLRSTLQTTTEDHRSALAQAKLAAAAELQKHAEELQNLLAEEQRQKDLLVAELQEKVKLIAQTNQLLEAQITQNKEQNNSIGHQVSSATKQINSLTIELPQNVTLDMAHIPGGQFLMGSPEGQGEDNEKPQHQVTVPEFWMGKYLVTQAQWRSIASLPQVKQELKPDPSKFKGDLRPVENVSWREAIEFCARLSRLTGQQYLLPSEAEWEYACRAETTTNFYFGDALTKNLANHSGSVGETTDVGSYAPNTFGLYDMHGNVWEWCQDHWHDSYEGAPIDGSAWLNIGENDNRSRLLRGGSWIGGPRNCRSAVRFRDLIDFRNGNCGFRVVYSPARTL